MELIKSLGNYDSVDRIDLVTRKMSDKRVNAIYSVPHEKVSEKSSIVRVPCGGKKYIRKEKLWPYLDEFTDRVVEYIQEQNRIPDFIHGHYADSGYVASQIANLFGIPFIFSAHSLGKNKLSFLLENGWTMEKANSEFSIQKRIDTEEMILSQAEMVVSSTNYEKEELYGMYKHHQIPDFTVIPPGMDLDKFFPYYHYQVPGNTIPEETQQAHIRVVNELKRFHFEPDKPCIITLCRPDARKNIETLIEAYGSDKELQAMANLAIFAGIREDITTMEEGEQQVLTDILLAMDKFDLYGKMAIPKYHNPEKDVPELYRYAALSRGVFVSASFLETFGLTFIEASACGLPFVATDKGGPVDIELNCKSGLLTNTEEQSRIAAAIKQILTDTEYWNSLSENGINNTRKVYTWENHCDSYIQVLKELSDKSQVASFKIERENTSIGKRLHSLKELLIVDVDDTLLGDENAVQQFADFLNEKKDEIGFGVATGRDIDSTRQVLQDNGITNVDVFISSVGSEIYYRENKYDLGWSSHIKRKWNPDRIRQTLGKLDFISLQEEPASQRDFKISYVLDDRLPPGEAIPLVHDALMDQKVSYNLIFSHGCFLDILPYRVSKGLAIRYLSHKWRIPLHNILTAGNSGNDTDMLTGSMRGIVVGNYEPELEPLKKRPLVYFAENNHAFGILEGYQYWKKTTTVDFEKHNMDRIRSNKGA